LPKKLSESQKEDISKSFLNGESIKDIAQLYNYSTQTIIKQLKIILGDERFKIINSQNRKNKNNNKKKKIELNTIKKQNSKEKNNVVHKNVNIIESPEVKDIAKSINQDNFFELVPLTDGVDLNNRKDLITEPINNIKFPDVVYMLIDKKIELEINFLKDYPDWSFMPEDDLERKVIEIFEDHKIAKKLCSKNQKLIKVPNPNVFSLASDFLKAKGISRIIFKDLLISI
tara:strand:+ start:948 stop:1634 length:687 start_codon:yes stop_codon:yes gene_type:complete